MQLEDYGWTIDFCSGKFQLLHTQGPFSVDFEVYARGVHLLYINHNGLWRYDVINYGSDKSQPWEVYDDLPEEKDPIFQAKTLKEALTFLQERESI